LKKKFENLRAQYSPRQIFGILQKEFPYICEDTIRKIIYTRRNTIEEDEFNFSKESEEKWKVFAGL
jgi:IS30 family transposase